MHAGVYNVWHINHARYGTSNAQVMLKQIILPFPKLSPRITTFNLTTKCQSAQQAHSPPLTKSYSFNSREMMQICGFRSASASKAT
jgi:hypothetical protein